MIKCVTDDPREYELRREIISLANVIGMSPPQPVFSTTMNELDIRQKELHELIKKGPKKMTHQHDADPIKNVRPSEVLPGTMFQIGHRLFILTENVGPNRALGQIVWRFVPAIANVKESGTIIWPDDEPIEVFV